MITKSLLSDQQAFLPGEALSEKSGTKMLYPGGFLWYNTPDTVFSGGTL